jgi:hypothetical protein
MQKVDYAHRNAETLASFVAYCQANPEQRFWQALRNWARVGNFIFASDGVEMCDTFYWEGRDRDQA